MTVVMNTPKYEHPNKNTAQRIERARTQLLIRYPLWGSLSLHLNTSIGNETKTLATNGKTLFINAEFVNTLTDDELMGVIAHETGHCALGHVWKKRIGTRDPRKWNIAADHAINHILVNEFGLTLPHGCLNDYPNEYAESIYNKLPERGCGGSPGEDDGAGDGDDEQPGDCDGGKWGEDDTETQDGGGSLPDEWENHVKQATAQNPTAGTEGGVWRGEIDKLNNPQVDWRALLADYANSTITTDVSFNRPNRKYVPAGIYFPGPVKDDKEFVVAIDTSASVDDKYVQQFLTEVFAIVDTISSVTVHLYQCDTRITSYTVVEDITDVPTRRYGYGGTSFAPVFKDVDKKGLTPNALIYLTDGEAMFPPEPDYPVIWVIVPIYREITNIPYGDVIRINK